MTKILSGLLIGMIPFGLLVAKDYMVDTSHSQVEFKIKHLSVSNVKGNFGKFSGELDVSNNKLTTLNGEVDVNTINTNNKDRDEHIKDPEYFDVKKFPKATLKLVSISGNDGVYDLTIKGVTKRVTLNTEVAGTSKNQSGKEVVGLSLTGKINRKDFNIATNTPGVALGEEVTISIDIEGIEK